MNEKFDFKNAIKAPYLYYMLLGVAVGYVVLPKLLRGKKLL